MRKAYLQAISYYLPTYCLTNEIISSEHPEWSAEKISAKTGINRRYISAPDETALDMAEKAALRLFEEYRIDKAGIDFVILCTQSPDYILPTSACILQEKLGLSEDCAAYDYNLGCSGYVYGLCMAKAFIESSQAKSVLLLTSETYSKYLHPDDKSCRTIFGDGASASLITATNSNCGMNAEILLPAYKTIGSQYQHLIVETGGSRNPIRGGSLDQYTEDGEFEKNADYLYMNGKAIFDFTAQIVPSVVNQTLKVNELSKEEIDWFVFHQANKFMLNFSRMRCGIDIDKFVFDTEDGGNTVSSTIPISLKRMINKQQIQSNTHLLLCGFGVGMSIAGVVLKIS